MICALHLARRANEGPVNGRDIAKARNFPRITWSRFFFASGGRASSRAPAVREVDTRLPSPLPKPRSGKSFRHPSSRRSLCTASVIPWKPTAVRRLTSAAFVPCGSFFRRKSMTFSTAFRSLTCSTMSRLFARRSGFRILPGLERKSCQFSKQSDCNPRDTRIEDCRLCGLRTNYNR